MTFILIFISSNLFTLGRVAVDLEPLPRTIGVRQERIHPKSDATSYTHTHNTQSFTPRGNLF